ncbi:MAG: tail fiber domain-containing protein, partial [Bacteroidota bacterium]|nr:tail fiber domain-containing protein [Bacteroidota bacterium]
NSGSYNVMIGNNTGLSNLSGMNNVYLGTSAGLLNNGNSNVFIGYNAGRNANDISGQLFIDNSSTDMPLIYGNFDTDYFRINGTLEVTEEIIPSDIRLKENIVQLDQVLQKLAHLRGIYFDWKKIDGLNIKLNDRRQIGVIAQEVEQYFPELVAENEFGYKGVDYSKLTPILIEAVNEQQDIIDKQQSEIDELSKMIKELQALFDMVSDKE